MMCSMFSGSDNERDMGRELYYLTWTKVSDCEVKGNAEEGVLLLS